MIEGRIELGVPGRAEVRLVRASDHLKVIGHGHEMATVPLNRGGYELVLIIKQRVPEGTS